MSFPISSKISGSLCQNIAIVMRLLPKQLRPSIEQLFAKVASLVDLTSLYPGDAKDLSHCASLLSRKIALVESEQNAQKDLLRRALKIQQVIRSENSKSPKTIPVNLSDALFAQRADPPPLAQLLLLIQEIIELTGMECWPLSNWTCAMQNIYPYEERSLSDKEAWENFVKFYDRRPNRLNHLLSDFAKVYDEAETERKQIDDLRGVVGKDLKERFEMIYEFKDLKEGNWQKQSALLQRLLNALLTEESAEIEMREFLKRAWKFAIEASRALTHGEFQEPSSAESAVLSRFVKCIEQKSHQIGIREVFKSLSDLNLHKVNCLIETQSREHRDKVSDLFCHLYDKIEKITSELITDRGQSTWQQQGDLAQRAFHGLDHLKDSIPKIIKTIDTTFSQTFSATYSGYCEREVDLHSFEFQAQTLILQLIERSKALFAGDIQQLVRTGEKLNIQGYATNALDMGLAGAALPALVAFQSRFARFWSKALTVDSPIEARLSQGMGDLNVALGLLQISEPCRRDLYEKLRKKLRELQPQKMPEKREALQYAKIFPYLCHSSEVLPDSLRPPLERNRSHRLGVKKNASKGQRDLAKLSSFSKQEDQLFEVLLDPIRIIIPKGLNFKYLDSWTPPFDYHRRVSRWFDAPLPLNAKVFSEYCNKPLAYQKLMVQLHQFIPLADFFCHRGIELISQSTRQETIRRLLLPAELRIDHQYQQGVIIWAINSKNICYHRFFHIKLETDLILQTVQKAFGSSQPTSKSDEIEDGIKLQFKDREEDFVEIDELAKTASLRNAKIADLTLHLRFVN